MIFSGQVEIKWKWVNGKQGTATKGQKIISGMKIWTNYSSLTLQDGYPTALDNSVLFPLPGYYDVSKTLIKLL